MRFPDMYRFLCGQRFSFIQSGISRTSSRERIRVLSVLAINQKYDCKLIARHNRGVQRGCLVNPALASENEVLISTLR